MANFTPEEKETLISTSEADETWKIYTLQPRIVTKLRKVGIEPIRVDSDGAHYFEVDFSQVSFRKKSEGREMSEDQRMAAAERLKLARQNKLKEKESE